MVAKICFVSEILKSLTLCYTLGDGWLKFLVSIGVFIYLKLKDWREWQGQNHVIGERAWLSVTNHKGRAGLSVIVAG